MRSVLFVALAGLFLYGCPQDSTGSGDAEVIDPDSDGGGAGGVGGGMGGEGGMGGGVDPDMGRVGPRACADGVDNDDDGLIDLDDPGCEDANDRDETDPVPPECSDMIDNDMDGFTDFPQDPGCGSAGDDDELNDPVAPQCNDGIDNERDGLIDEQDPGCASVADPSEADPAEPPECFDGIDNDGDGIIDFPIEPGCSAAGDDTEMDPGAPAQCGNGLDDDNDGLVDFPNDPGCAGVGDVDETDKAVTPACADGIDNDRDGKTDYPDDDGCEAAADYNERGSCGDTYDPPSLRDGEALIVDSARGVFESQGSCGGAGSPEVVFQYRLQRDVEALQISTVGATEVPTTLYVRRGACLDPDSEVACQRESVDNDPFGHTLTLENPRRGDLYIFADGVAGEGGNVQITVTEVPLAQCLNGLDDDEDGRTDYPSDPGCESRDDRDEQDGDEFPVCADDEDNDGDGLIDYPNDPGCISAGADDEVDRCGAGVRFRQFFAGDDFVLGDSREAEGGARNAGGSCGGDRGPEIVYLYRNPHNARLVFSTRHVETQVSTVLHVRRECGDVLTEEGCDDGAAAGGMQGEVEIEQAAVGDYWVFVDTQFGMGGPFKLSVEVERLDPGCSDGLDNDEDGRVDGDDPGCVDADDEDERNEPGDPVAACNNGADDDGDNLVDFPFDPGCLTRGDDDEADDGEPTACANGLDDDEDGFVDFPLDPGCQGRGDDQEEDGLPRPQCFNRIDDDQDNAIDYPLDPGCYGAGDQTEADVGEPPVCFNQIDDDRDGIADFPFDRGCESAGDNTEEDLEEAPVCSNGEDDDGDGITDFPLDPGCRYAADPDEESPRFPPECANDRDDDMDGRPDFPDDPGCRFAADRSEVNDGAIPPRCADGVDNDFDGSIDLQDIGCLDGGDDDEADPDGDVPLCGNEIDDDLDDLADWPDDPGCQARGDLTEDQGCRPDVETPLIPRNGTVRGATAEDGPDNYHNRCGGRMAPDLVYKYVLEAQADLTFSTDNENTDYPVVISVRNDCEEPESQLACAGNFAAPDPTVTLRDAEPGEYYVYIDGGGPEQWVSSGGQVQLADPRGFMANQDIRDACGWGDGGGDAFDCFGRTITLTHAGAASANISPLVGAPRPVAAGAYRANFQSDFVHRNIWRLRFTPQEDFDERLVDIQLVGNLGSDGSTQQHNQSVMFQGRQIDYIVTSDGPLGQPRSDPPVVHFIVPGDPEQLGNVQFARANDTVTYNVQQVKLPVTMYIGIGYAAHNDVVAAMLSDIEIQAGPEGNDAPRFGNFELSVTED